MRGGPQDEDGTGELAFDRASARLPWLESDDDYEEPRGSPAKIVLVTLAGLAAFAVVAAGTYWLTADGAEAELAPEGATIEAPEGPYKVRPENPGGATALGTGDTSFAVAEGRSPRTRMAPPQPQPTPSATEPADGPEAPPAPSGVGVQVGAYSSKDRAEQGWQTLSARHERLKGVNHRVVEGIVDGSTVYRLQALAGNAAAARELCADLKASGADCQVKN